MGGIVGFSLPSHSRISRLLSGLPASTTTRSPGFKPSLLEGSHVAYIPGTSLLRRSVFDRLGEFENRWTMTSDLVWFARLRECGEDRE